MSSKLDPKRYQDAHLYAIGIVHNKARSDSWEFKVYYNGEGSILDALLVKPGADPNQEPRQHRVRIEAIDRLVQSSAKCRYVSETFRAAVHKQLLPDGSTATHNADGTPKKAKERVAEQLVNEGIIAKDPYGHLRNISEEEQAAKSQRSHKVGPEDVAQTADDVRSGRNLTIKTPPSSGGDMLAAEDDSSLDNWNTEYENDEYDDDYDDEPQEQSEQRNRPAKRQRQKDIADKNGDGLVDEFDDLVAEEQKTNLAVMIVFLGGILLSIVLFFLCHAAIATVMHGEPLDLIPSISDITSGTGEEEQQADEQNQGNSTGGTGDNSSNSQNATATDSTGATVNTVQRDDFDPENAVASFAMADADKERIAVAIMQAIRSDILNGDVNSFAEAVDLESISAKLATAYAETAAAVQGLSAEEKKAVAAMWNDTFIQSERQHVVNKDSYGSIFGGRIREVRQDPENSNRIYIVMESIAGDHQRICLVADGDAEGNWMITDVVDPTGYAQMIQEGEVWQ